MTSYFCIPVPYNEKDIFLGVLVLESLVGLIKLFNFSFFSITKAKWLSEEASQIAVKRRKAKSKGERER